MQGRHVSRGCWGFSGWVLWAWTVGFKGTLGLACEPRSAWCVRPMWLALGTLYVVRVVVVGLGFGLRTHVSILFFVVVRSFFRSALAPSARRFARTSLGFGLWAPGCTCLVVVAGWCSIVYELPRAGP